MTEKQVPIKCEEAFGKKRLGYSLSDSGWDVAVHETVRERIEQLDPSDYDIGEVADTVTVNL